MTHKMNSYSVAPTELHDHEMSEVVVLGPPKCRNFHQTGAPFDLRPHLPFEPHAEGPIPWRWFPWKIRIRMPLLLNTLAGSSTIVSLIVFGTQLFFRPAVAVCVLIFLNLLFTVPLLYMAYIMTFNFKLREGLCWAKGKSVQAKMEWKKSTDPSRAKHVFFEWKVGSGLVLKVLNDGSQEIWNIGGDQLAGELAGALGVSGLMGGAMGGSNGFVDAGVADGAVINKRTDQDSPNNSKV